jgi:hypothetical protein
LAKKIFPELKSVNDRFRPKMDIGEGLATTQKGRLLTAWEL